MDPCIFIRSESQIKSYFKIKKFQESEAGVYERVALKDDEKIKRAPVKLFVDRPIIEVPQNLTEINVTKKA